VTAPFEDLPQDQQDRITEMVAAAPPLSQRQRSELERLFSAAEEAT